jgi:hypothetical protein
MASEYRFGRSRSRPISAFTGILRDTLIKIVISAENRSGLQVRITTCT